LTLNLLGSVHAHIKASDDVALLIAETNRQYVQIHVVHQPEIVESVEKKYGLRMHLAAGSEEAYIKSRLSGPNAQGRHL